MMKIYDYKSCDTCRKALKFLDARGAKYERIPIVDRPPSLAELRRMLGFVGDLKKLFNTSGQVYRELKIGERLKSGLSEKDALTLLAANGKLIKRPFLLGPHFGAVGFNEETWKELIRD